MKSLKYYYYYYYLEDKTLIGRRIYGSSSIESRLYINIDRVIVWLFVFSSKAKYRQV